MKPTRRWFQYSLRSSLVLLTALAVWLGIVVNRAREQREAVEAIEALGGQVYYDWQVQPSSIPVGSPYFGSPFASPLILNPNAKHCVPEKLRRIVGDHFVQKVSMVYLLNLRINMEGDQADRSRRYNEAVTNSIPSLQRLRGLKVVGVWHGFPADLELKLKAALPNCTIVLVLPVP